MKREVITTHRGPSNNLRESFWDDFLLTIVLTNWRRLMLAPYSLSTMQLIKLLQEGHVLHACEKDEDQMAWQ